MKGIPQWRYTKEFRVEAVKLVTSKIKEHILTMGNLTKLVELVNEEMDAAASS